MTFCECLAYLCSWSVLAWERTRNPRVQGSQAEQLGLGLPFPGFLTLATLAFFLSMSYLSLLLPQGLCTDFLVCRTSPNGAGF